MWKSYYVAAKNETTYIAMLFQIGIDMRAKFVVPKQGLLKD